MARPRSSAQLAPCSRASRPVRDSCGWAPLAAVQRRNSCRCRDSAAVGPRKPRGSRAVSPRVGSARTSLLVRAQAKNCRSGGQPALAVSPAGWPGTPRCHGRRRWPSRPCRARRPGRRPVPDGGQPVLDRAVRAGPGAGPAGAFPVFQARPGECRHRGAERLGNGVDPALPAAGCEPLGLVQSAGPGRGSRRTFPGCGPGCPVTGRGPAAVIVPAGPAGAGSAVCQQPPELADQARRPGGSEPGGGAGGEVAEPGRRVIEPGGQAAGRRRTAAAGCFCQQRPHRPDPQWRRSSPHPAQIRGGSFGGPGREQLPHQPVCSRRYPGLPQRGHCPRGLLPLAPVMAARAAVPVPQPDRTAAVGARPRARRAPARRRPAARGPGRSPGSGS